MKAWEKETPEPEQFCCCCLFVLFHSIPFCSKSIRIDLPILFGPVTKCIQHSRLIQNHMVGTLNKWACLGVTLEICFHHLYSTFWDYFSQSGLHCSTSQIIMWHLNQEQIKLKAHQHENGVGKKISSLNFCRKIIKLEARRWETW